jgi:hypothetical protein
VVYGISRYTAEELKDLFMTLLGMMYGEDVKLSDIDLANSALGALRSVERYKTKVAVHKMLRDNQHKLDPSQRVDLEDLKYGKSNLCDYDDVIVYMIELSIDDVPLYINSKDWLVVAIAEWRLKVGR